MFGGLKCDGLLCLGVVDGAHVSRWHVGDGVVDDVLVVKVRDSNTVGNLISHQRMVLWRFLLNYGATLCGVWVGGCRLGFSFCLLR